jgi:hypothetical protein
MFNRNPPKDDCPQSVQPRHTKPLQSLTCAPHWVVKFSHFPMLRAVGSNTQPAGLRLGRFLWGTEITKPAWAGIPGDARTCCTASRCLAFGSIRKGKSWYMQYVRGFISVWFNLVMPVGTGKTTETVFCTGYRPKVWHLLFYFKRRAYIEVFGKRMLRRSFWPEIQDVTGGWKVLHSEYLNIYIPYIYICI